ncbi:MAG: glycoside hydrolase family 130 protein [Acidimicrobiales bacterium]
MSAGSLLRRIGPRLSPDRGRVVARLFVPGEELPGHHSRATTVLQRVQALSDTEVTAAVADLRGRFGGRHRDLDQVFLHHFGLVAHRLAGGEPTTDRRLLIGAYFTAEYVPEGAAMTNPSMVPHPDQSGLAAGEIRFVMAVRSVGEGHLSCIEFRTGVVSEAGRVTVHEAGRYLDMGQPVASKYDHASFRALVVEQGIDDETASFVLDGLGDPFLKSELDAAVACMHPQIVSRPNARETIDGLARIALNNYEVTFPPSSAISERILYPSGPSESHGMEDARLTRFVEDDGTVRHCATYTAYDGWNVDPQLLETDDFLTFRVSQLTGPAATNKGLALFPRKVGGTYLALSRYDRERSSITTSDDLRRWGNPVTIETPLRPWELIQTGNCGPPIETERGWLVLTHGVGAMRTYGLGALLLDLDDPRKVLGTTDLPILLPDDTEQDGYVPNVVYSCGAMRHGDMVILPYGFGDQQISFALLDLPQLYDLLR